MEPLRHPSFKMGANDYWSWTWALIFVTAGALLIAVNHIIRFTKNNKTNAKMAFSKKNSLISLSVLCGLGLGFVVAGIVIMILNPFEAKLEFTGFNIGIIFLASGVSLIFLGSAILYELLFTKKHQEVAIDA